jgi:hypothetical protein
VEGGNWFPQAGKRHAVVGMGVDLGGRRIIKKKNLHMNGKFKQ